MNTIKKIINWLNYYCGGLRGDDCFFDVEENGMFDDLAFEEKINNYDKTIQN